MVQKWDRGVRCTAKNRWGNEGLMSSIVSRRPSARWFAALAAAGGLGLMIGCNVFTPLAADSQKDLNYRGLILKGNQAINDQDYDAAESYFADAMAMNPRGSEAYLYRSKALMNKYKIDYNSLNKEFEVRRNKDGNGKKGIPFLDSNTTLKSIDSIYYPIAQSVENLEHIIRKSSASISLESGYSLPPDGDTASDGKVSEGVARLDLGLLEAVKAMLGPLDLDGDNHISAECGKNVCPTLAAACMATPAYTSRCKDGITSEVIRFENFKILTKSINIADLSSDDVRARQVSTNPNDINAFLDKMQGPIAGSNFNLDSVTNVMNDHNETKLSGNLSEIVGNIKDLSFFLAYMRYNDGVDNDYDASAITGKGPIMVWHDYDKDGGIRWNYDDNSTTDGYEGFPSEAPQNGEAHNIGHPIHRMLHPELYIKFSDPEWLQRPISGDTSKNSRKSLMIKHCQDVSANLVEIGKMDAATKVRLISVICPTYTSIIKPGIVPPAHSDWIGGTFGIDEEMVDDRDNDYDGIKDEDARNAKGMDDDDDALLNPTMVGTMPAPMVWKDVAGHENKCPDIDTAVAMLAPPLQRQFCIGALEHRIYLAQHGTGTTPAEIAKSAKDTLAAYYSAFLGEGPNKNCLEDFDKLPQAYKDKVGIASNSDPAVRLACHYKHIWIHGGANVPPPRSEWTSGIFGIDEEFLDGVDNDGDGWIDEDVK